MNVLLFTFDFKSLETMPVESINTDLLTSTIIRTVGSVVCKFCGWGGLIVTGTTPIHKIQSFVNFQILQLLYYATIEWPTYQHINNHKMQKLNLILEDILKLHDRQCLAFLFLIACTPPFLLACEVESKLKFQLFLPK